MASTRLHAVGGLADDLHAFQLAEQEAQLLPGELFVVGHDGRQGLSVHDASLLAGAAASGISTCASAPLPGAPDRSSRPDAP